MAKETNGGATKLEWSDDDEDDFFSEDGKQSGVSAEESFEEDFETSNLPDGVQDTVIDANEKDDCDDDKDDAMDEPESVSGASPSRTTVPTKKISSQSPGLPPLSGRAVDKVPSTPNSMVSIDNARVPMTPLSLVESASTPLVEPEDQDFEEIVRKRNRVS